MDETELIINAATLFAKDLIVDNQNLQKLLARSSTKPNECDFDESDLDLFVYSKIIKRRKLQHAFEENRVDRLEESEANSWKESSQSTSNQFFKFLRDCEDLTFENQFKLSKHTFEELQRVLDLYIDPYMKTYFGKQSLSKLQVFLIALWLLTSEESLKCVSDRFGVSQTNCHKALVTVSDAVYTNKQIFIKWPFGKRAEHILQQFTYAVDENSFPNVFGVIGCTDIIVPKAVNNIDLDNENKAYSFVKLQAVCDSRGIFLNSFVEMTEISSNVLVFNRSPLKRMLEKKQSILPTDSHLIGNQTYPLKTYLMVPFKEYRRSEQKELFNKSLELKNQIIDIAFNRLKERFSKLKFLNMNEPKEIIRCIEVACAFHNFCIQQNDSYYLQLENHSKNETKVICRDFNIDQRAIDKRNVILHQFEA